MLHIDLKNTVFCIDRVLETPQGKKRHEPASLEASIPGTKPADRVTKITSLLMLCTDNTFSPGSQEFTWAE
jgi:hypothetical protein